LQVRVEPTIDQRGMGDGDRPARTLLTETRLGQSLSDLVLVEQWIDASVVVEGNRAAIGGVLPVIERACERSFERVNGECLCYYTASFPDPRHSPVKGYECRTNSTPSPSRMRKLILPFDC
jgi:hypothetical protein